MSVDGNFQGSLFSNDFLRASISALPDWATLPDEAIDGLATELLEIFDRFPVDQTPNESQTEDDLIWPILGTLGWTASLRQQNLTRQGREDVPDGVLFSDQQTKDRANRFAQEWRRYGLGLAVVESKRWLCQWRSKKGPPRRCKKGPLGGCGLVPVVHGRAPRATRRALNRLTRRRAREGPVGPRGQAWAGWSVQLAVGV